MTTKFFIKALFISIIISTYLGIASSYSAVLPPLSFSTAADLPDPLYDNTAIRWAEWIYVIGGVQSNASSSNFIYRGTVGTDGNILAWTPVTPMPKPRELHASVIRNNFLYIIGGNEFPYSPKTTVFMTHLLPDGTLDTWNSLPGLPQPLMGHSAVVVGDFIYVLGGQDGSMNRKATVYMARIDYATGGISPWETTTSLPTGLALSGAIAWKDRIYLVGGIDGTGTIRQSVFYSTVSTNGSLGPWQVADVLPQGLITAGVSVKSGLIFVTGGMNTSFTTNSSVFTIPINADGSVSTTNFYGYLPQPFRAGASVIHFKKRLYVIGGQGDSSVDSYKNVFYSQPLETINTYPLTSWDTTQTIPTALYQLGFGAINDYVYVVGGVDTSGNSSSDVLYARHNADGSFSDGGNTSPLPVGISNQAVVTWNKNIYSIGGMNARDNVYFSRQKDDGSLLDWQTTSALPRPIIFSDAAVYQGNIYLVGGEGDWGYSTTVYHAVVNELTGQLGPWIAERPFPISLTDHRTVVWNNVLYVIGGVQTYPVAIPAEPSKAVYYSIINPVDGSLGPWTRTTDIPKPTMDFGAVAVNGKIYIMGGYTFDTAYHSTQYSDVYHSIILADGSLDTTWKAVIVPLPEPLRQHAAGLSNGRIVVVGGKSGDTVSDQVFQSNLLFDIPREVYSVYIQSSGFHAAPVWVYPPDIYDWAGGITDFSRAYYTGSTVHLYAQPSTDNGMTFQKWVMDTTEIFNNPLEIQVDNEKSPVAVYTGNIPSGATLTILSNPEPGIPIPSPFPPYMLGTTNFTLNCFTGQTVMLIGASPLGTSKKFDHWEVIGTNSFNTIALYLSINMYSNATVIYHYKQTFDLVAQSQPDNGVSLSVSPSDTTGSSGGITEFTRTYYSGATVNVMAPPSFNSKPFQKWVLDGVDLPVKSQLQNVVGPNINIMMFSNHTVVAVYQSTSSTTTYLLQVQSQPTTGISISDSPTHALGITNFDLQLSANTTINLIAPPVFGNLSFVKWLIDGNTTSSMGGSIMVIMDQPHTAVAIYTTMAQPPSYQLTCQSSPDTGAVFTLSPADNSGMSGGTTQFICTYNQGTMVYVYASSTFNSKPFQKWLLDGRDLPVKSQLQNGAGPNINVLMFSAHTVTAVYQSTSSTTTYLLQVQSQPTTGVVISTATHALGTTNFDLHINAGDTITMIALPTFGNMTFSQWLIDGNTTSSIGGSIMVIMDQPHTAVAVYTTPPVTRRLTCQSSPVNGATLGVSPADIYGLSAGTTEFNCTYIQGTVVRVVARSPFNNGSFLKWVLDGVDQSTSGTSKLAAMPGINISMFSDHTVVAVYQSITTYTLQVQSQPTTGIVISAPTHDLGTTNFSLQVNAGDTVILMAPSPNGDLLFDHWQLQSNPPITFNTLTVIMNADQSAIAYYRQPLQVSIYATPTSGTAPLEVHFYSTVTGTPLSYAWTFGDGGTSTTANPTYSYQSAGFFSVRLIVGDSYGAVTVIQPVMIHVLGLPPLGYFYASQTSGYVPVNIQFFSIMTGGRPDSINWDLGDGTHLSGVTVNHTYTTNGHFTIQMSATNAYGSLTVTKTDYLNISLASVIRNLNPGKLITFPSYGGIKFFWENPVRADYSATMIVYRTDRYPVDQSDGTMMYWYNGTACNFAGTNGQKYYFGIFAHDTAMNFAPGVFVAGIPNSYDNVKDFTIYEPWLGAAGFRWTNPIESRQHDSQILIRRRDRLPVDPADGYDPLSGLWFEYWYNTQEFGEMGLTVGSTYYYGMYAVDTMMNFAGGVAGAFIPGNTGISNVSSLRVIPGYGSIFLNWINPTGSNYVSTLVVKQNGRYPSNPTDGTIAYWYNGNSFLDSGLTMGQKYFYGIFTQDTAVISLRESLWVNIQAIMAM